MTFTNPRKRFYLGNTNCLISETICAKCKKLGTLSLVIKGVQFMLITKIANNNNWRKLWMINTVITNYNLKRGL